MFRYRAHKTWSQHDEVDGCARVRNVLGLVESCTSVKKGNGDKSLDDFFDAKKRVQLFPTPAVFRKRALC